MSDTTQEKELPTVSFDVSEDELKEMHPFEGFNDDEDAHDNALRLATYFDSQGNFFNRFSVAVMSQLMEYIQIGSALGNYLVMELTDEQLVNMYGIIIQDNETMSHVIEALNLPLYELCIHFVAKTVLSFREELSEDDDDDENEVL